MGNLFKFTRKKCTTLLGEMYFRYIYGESRREAHGCHRNCPAKMNEQFCRL